MLISQILTSLRCGNQLLNLSSPVVMSVLNVTPDSFYAPSRTANNLEKTLEKASQMALEGARIIDVGGMSSRPGATEISEAEEMDRIIPVIEILAKNLPSTVISADTYRSRVAEEAIKAGATMINDISGGSLDEALWDVVARHPVSYVIMHMRGKPENMQAMTDYQDVISDLLKYFVNKLRGLHRLGIRDVILDPGFGFSKKMEQNFQVIDQLNVFRMLGYPTMIGVSRKSSISQVTGRSAEETLDGTTALHMAALMKGASILRVHDVKPAIDAIAIYNKLHEAKIH